MKYYKKILLLIIASTLATSDFILNDVLAADSIVLRFAHSASADSPKGKMAIRFQELVQARIGSQSVKVEVYPNGILFDDDQLVSAVLKNRAQLIATPISNLQPYVGRFKLFDLPFLFVTEKAASRFLNGEYGGRLLNLIDKAGAVGLAFLNNGMKQLSATKKIVTPKDAENVKFLISDSNVTDIQFRQVGARPIVGSLNKVVSQLKTQVVDGQENTWSNMYTQGIYKHQPYVLESNHVYLADVIVASKEAWKGIPEGLRATLLEQLKQAVEYGNKLASQQSLYEKQLIIDSGETVAVQMTVEQRELWVEAMQGVWKKFENQIGSGLINAAASAR